MSAGLGPRYCGRLERGERGASLEAAAALARALGVGLGKLLGETTARVESRPALRRVTLAAARWRDEDLDRIERILRPMSSLGPARGSARAR